MIAHKDYDTAVIVVRTEMLELVRMRSREKHIIVIVNQYTRILAMQSAFVTLFKSKDRKFNEQKFREDCNAQEYTPTAARTIKNVRLVQGKIVANDSQTNEVVELHTKAS